MGMCLLSAHTSKFFQRLRRVPRRPTKSKKVCATKRHKLRNFGCQKFMCPCVCTYLKNFRHYTQPYLSAWEHIPTSLGLKGVCIPCHCKECNISNCHNFTTFSAFPVKSKYVREEYWSYLFLKIDPQYVYTKPTTEKNVIWAKFWLKFDFLCRMCAHTYFFNFLFHTHWYHYQMCKILRFQTNRIKIDEIVI